MTTRVTIERPSERDLRITLVADVQIVADAKALEFSGDPGNNARQGHAVSGPPVSGEPESALLTVDEAAELLNISRDKVYHLLRMGQLRSIKIGRLRRISRDWITEFTVNLANTHL